MAELLEQHRLRTQTVAMLDDMLGAGEMTRQNYARAMSTAQAELEAID